MVFVLFDYLCKVCYVSVGLEWVVRKFFYWEYIVGFDVSFIYYIKFVFIIKFILMRVIWIMSGMYGIEVVLF